MPQDVIIGRDESDMKRFGKRGLMFIGKQWVKMGQMKSLSNRILMDVARSHVVMIAGKRGSGKSYSLSVIAEELTNLPEDVRQNVAGLIFDTMGIFWTMTYRNEKELDLLREWQLEPKKLPVIVYAPFAYINKYEEYGITAKPFALDVSEITADDWLITFGLSFIDPVGILIERVIMKLKEAEHKFNIIDIINEIKSDKETGSEAKQAAVNLFEGASSWGIFSSGEESTKVTDLVNAGKTTVLDLSMYSSIGTFNVRALVIGLITKKLFQYRMEARKAEEVEAVRHGMEYLKYSQKRKMPLVWLFVDEAHEFIPEKGKTAATDALIQLLREGRQPGLSFVMATQQPGKIHSDAMTQSDIIISHRLTAKPDIQALSSIMQSYLAEDIITSLNNLPKLKGSALLLDDNSERIYMIRVRPKFTWHGGEAPTAIKAEKRE